jgi:hypothetical protein
MQLEQLYVYCCLYLGPVLKVLLTVQVSKCGDASTVFPDHLDTLDWLPVLDPRSYRSTLMTCRAYVLS